MNLGWVFARNVDDIPAWMRDQAVEETVVTEVKNVKKLEVKVEMCCNTCVEKVEQAVCGMTGVAEYTTDRWNDRLTIVESPSGGPDHKQLVKKLKKATHAKQVKILDSTSGPASTTTTTTTTVSQPSTSGYALVPVPWAPGTSSDITNPYYFQHPVGCGNCIHYPGAVCANCGRASPLGARFP